MGGIAPSPTTAVILSESPPRFHRKIRAVSTTIQNAQRKTGRAVKNMTRSAVILGCLLPAFLASQEMHDHPPPEKLGTVLFATSCKLETNQEFNRAVALLHSFAYKAAEEAFQRVTQQDPECAIAHWGIAMTHYHPLWEPVLPPAGIAAAQQ
jgi:hypothetical protein